MLRSGSKGKEQDLPFVLFEFVREFLDESRKRFMLQKGVIFMLCLLFAHMSGVFCDKFVSGQATDVQIYSCFMPILYLLHNNVNCQPISSRMSADLSDIKIIFLSCLLRF